MLSREEFLKRANAKRDDYDYSMTDYKGQNTKVMVKCKACRKRGWIFPRQIIRGDRIFCDCVKDRRGRRYGQLPC